MKRGPDLTTCPDCGAPKHAPICHSAPAMKAVDAHVAELEEALRRADGLLDALADYDGDIAADTRVLAVRKLARAVLAGKEKAK